MSDAEKVYHIYMSGVALQLGIGLTLLGLVLQPSLTLIFSLIGLCLIISLSTRSRIRFKTIVSEEWRDLTKKYKYSPYIWIVVIIAVCMTAGLTFASGLAFNDIVLCSLAAMVITTAICSLMYCFKLRAKFQSA